ncbi:Sphingomyelin phosphodiesterase D LrSicTox-alphaIB1, partial [Stegodyphus mimosarum]
MAKHTRIVYKTLYVFTVIFASQCLCAERRPFYIIGHMVNSIGQIKHYLDLGANVIEADIQFHPNGSVREVYHGFPCDCFRTCSRSAKLSDYLKYVRKITDPSEPNSYFNKMVMQFFDLKLSGSGNKRISGRDLARHVLDYLWTPDRRRQEVRALIYIDSTQDREAIRGFLEEFKARGEESRLKDVGFDGGSGDLNEIRRMFNELQVQGNIWQGDGKSNCFSPIYPDGRLRRALDIRDSDDSYISKVYHWTIDLKIRMRLSLNLGVDGMITNDPDDLIEVLQESYYRDDFRLATPDDDPFARF